MSESINTSFSKLGVKSSPSIKYNKITNCILDIPQDIKFQSTDSLDFSVSIRLTSLDISSIVYIPNGFNEDGTRKFDKVNISGRITQRNTNKKDYCWLVYHESVNQDNNFKLFISKEIFIKTTTDESIPSTAKVVYDLSTNYFTTTESSERLSLPIMFIYSSKKGYLTIENLFYGFGYLQWLLFSLPGVKYLCPNGRNEDCTFKNEVITTTDVKLSHDLAKPTASSNILLQLGEGLYIPQADLNYYSSSTPSSTNVDFYNTSKNLRYYINTDGKQISSSRVDVGTFTTDESSNVIPASFNINYPSIVYPYKTLQ